MLSLTVVIATYNRSENLNRGLDALIKQTDKKFDVLIVDGGSTDETYKIIKKFKNELTIYLVVDKTPHLAYIRDLGWRTAKGEIVVSIDDDVVVSKNWIKAIKQSFSDKSIGGVTGPTVIPERLLKNRDIFLFYTTKNSTVRLLGEIYFKLFTQGEKYAIGKIYPSGCWSPGSNFPKALKLKKPIRVDYLEACNFAVPRKILKEVGGYDLEYKGTSEWCEVDLAFRIRKAGYKLLFDPAVAVEHHVSSCGVFSRRMKTVVRFKNFISFYFKTYYPKTIGGFLEFILYVQFLTFYWFYLSFKKNSK